MKDTTIFRELLKPLYQYARYHPLRVKSQSPFDNIFYCCTQKTASQWFKEIFRNPITFRYSGLKPIPYTKLGLNYAQFNKPFPHRSAVLHLYIDYETYLTIAKPASFRTFFILRDPRDIAVSWYFSMKYSHVPIGPVADFRKKLADLDEKDGIMASITHLNEIGLFAAQESWLLAEKHDENVKLFRYEEFAADNRAFLRNLLTYLKIDMPAAAFAALYAANSYEKITGRPQGVEVKRSHYRKGVAGDWQNYFDQEMLDHFNAVTGDLANLLGYQTTI